MTASSTTTGDSFESDTLTDELALNDKHPPKRHRRRTSSIPTQPSSSVDSRRKQAQRSSSTTASSARLPPPPNGYHWLWYSFKPLADGTFEFNCVIRGRTYLMTAEWVPGETCSRVSNEKWKRWLQTSLDSQNLQIFSIGRLVTLEKSA